MIAFLIIVIDEGRLDSAHPKTIHHIERTHRAKASLENPVLDSWLNPVSIDCQLLPGAGKW